MVGIRARAKPKAGRRSGRRGKLWMDLQPLIHHALRETRDNRSFGPDLSEGFMQQSEISDGVH
jgi:hypothetical protein